MDTLLCAAFLYSLLAVSSLPLFACGLVDCSGDSDGYKSISEIVHKGPLATSFSYFGSLFLWCLLAIQLHTRQQTLPLAILSVLAVQALSVPLVIPLGSVYSDSYHSTFAVAGAILETLVSVLWLVRQPCVPMAFGFILQVSAFVIGAAGLWSPASAFQSVSLLVAEYAFGVGTVMVTLTTYAKHLSK
jgi:hypothetical protein